MTEGVSVTEIASAAAGEGRAAPGHAAATAAAAVTAAAGAVPPRTGKLVLGRRLAFRTLDSEAMFLWIPSFFN